MTSLSDCHYTMVLFVYHQILQRYCEIDSDVQCIKTRNMLEIYYELMYESQSLPGFHVRPHSVITQSSLQTLVI